MYICFLLIFLYVSSCTIYSSPCLQGKGSAITYTLTKHSRLGDHLLQYIAGKYISHISQLPLLYVPFEYSNYFSFDKNEQCRYKTFASSFKKRVLVLKKPEGYNTSFKEAKTLYTLSLSECITNFEWANNVLFKKEIQEAFKPVKKLTLVKVPQGKITIAVHVRRGSGVDSVNYIKTHPLRFCPDSYYIEHIKWIANYFKEFPLYVHIFTDDTNPAGIVKKFKHAVAGKNLEFGLLKSNQSSAAILSDFFSLMQFDCIIRSNSHFSKVANLIHDFAVSIFPTSVINGTTLIVKRDIKEDLVNKTCEKMRKSLRVLS